MDIFSRSLQSINWPRGKYQHEYNNLVKELTSKVPYVLFVGAGVSKNPYPDWEELVTSISSQLTISLTEDEKKNIVGSALQIMEKCRNIDRDKFYALLKTQFNPAGKIDYKPLHLDLLMLPLVGFITTNIDVCLVKAASRLPERSRLNGFFYYPDNLPASDLKTRNLFHIHGIVINHKGEDTIEYTLLTESDYNNGYPEKIEPFLQSAFKDVCTVFVGFSLNDPAIKRILENCKKHQEELKKLNIARTCMPVNHYIFLPSIYEVDSDSNTISEDEEREDNEDLHYLDT